MRDFGITDLVRGTRPVVSTVFAALLIILGILVVVYPALLNWVVGIGLVLAGIAMLAAIIATTRQYGR
ncbi:hypothetical protein NITHO_3010021 [Nitrolancea hollandica Lb]|uniref:Uncharacterized protein n=2 Tax=Nitrolancea hollandica TaxID=1206749 RepID=I4EH78_9BACT|nr:hypothetical protein NITHO_3010021 [Nitrolancea hollandica Lb]